MDPFSITAGVVSLVAIVSKCIKGTSNYAHTAAGAKKQAASMKEALAMLQDILERLRGRLEDRPSLIDQSSSSTDSPLGNTLKSCQSCIERVLNRLSQAQSASKASFVLRWPFDKRDYEETMTNIRMFAQWIQLSLSAENSELLAKTLRNSDVIVQEQNRATTVLRDINSTLK